ncbi:hypothetical protein RW64_09260 [Geobacter sulfurreducens]|nr:hypothetical protein RW64_09260 [Geobacter sulfurreducens]
MMDQARRYQDGILFYPGREKIPTAPPAPLPADTFSAKATAVAAAVAGTLIPSILFGVAVGMLFPKVFPVCVICFGIPMFFYAIYDRAMLRIYHGWLNWKRGFNLLKYGWFSLEMRPRGLYCRYPGNDEVTIYHYYYY